MLGLLALAQLLVSGCPARTRDADVAGEHGECSVRLAAAQLPAGDPPELATPRSRLSVEVSAELSAVERELERQVPVSLAGERRRPIGTPGDVSYAVSRGRVTSKLVSDRLVVAVPVAVHVEVCKPLGPFCPTYGECNPRLSAIASVPLLLGEDYEIGRSRVGVNVVRGCSIAGINATPEVEKRARGAVGIVQARIDSAAPRVRPAVAAIWELLHHPVSLGSSACLRIAPERLSQARPRSEPGRLISRLSAEGTLSVEDPCARPDAKLSVSPLPRLETKAELPADVDLRVPIVTSFSDVSAALERSVLVATNRPGRSRIVKLQASGTRSRGRGAVAIRASLTGETCGEAVWLAEPWFDAATSRARFRDLRLVTGQTDSPELARLARQIEQNAAVPLPVDVSAGPGAVEGLIRGFGEGLPASVSIETHMSPALVEEVQAASTGLVAVATFKGTAAVRLR
jgi:hypothetical protein